MILYTDGSIRQRIFDPLDPTKNKRVDGQSVWCAGWAFITPDGISGAGSSPNVKKSLIAETMAVLNALEIIKDHEVTILCDDLYLIGAINKPARTNHIRALQDLGELWEKLRGHCETREIKALYLPEKGSIIWHKWCHKASRVAGMNECLSMAGMRPNPYPPTPFE